MKFRYSKKYIFPFLLVFITLISTHECMVYAQSDAGLEASKAEYIWRNINQRLDDVKQDTSLGFITHLVREACGDDYSCLRPTYKTLIYKLEREHFHLPAAIYLCNELIHLARIEEDQETLADTYGDLSRYHDALGNRRLGLIYLDKAIPLYRDLGYNLELIISQMTKLEFDLTYQDINDVLPQMNALLEKAVNDGDTSAANFLRLRLTPYTIMAGKPDQAMEHIKALEQIPVSSPPERGQYGLLIIISRGKGDIHNINSNWSEAEQYYKKALQYSRQEPDRWSELDILHKLAVLEMKRDNNQLAQRYLDTAYANAASLELDNMLAENYHLQAQIAESKGDYKTALKYYKKEKIHETSHKERSKGFNVENYYLQLEKEQLAAEKRNQDLKLSLRNVQLRNSLIILILVLLLTGGMFYGLNKQRKAQKTLKAQHDVIRQQTNQLQNLDKAKSRFFANVSHELRTPLTLIIGPIKSLLREKGLSEKQQALLKTAEHNSKDLQRLVNEIMDLRKLDMGKMNLQTEPTYLVPFFRQYLTQFESLAHRKDINYTYQISVHEDTIVNIDREKTRQIVYNLLSNAFKFTPADQEIGITVSLKDGMLNLTVADTGTGIHQDDLPHLFDRYFQTTRPDKPVEGGTGIGLALCKKYAELMGGEIQAESTLEKGTIINVTFPVSTVEASELPEQVAIEEDTLSRKEVQNLTGGPASDSILAQLVPNSGNGDKHTLLLVEDNPDLQDFIRIELSDQYTVYTAENGQEALAFLRDNAYPSLILSDLMMPVMDGYQLLDKLKSSDETRHIPVIMLTARTGQEDKLRALRIGVDDYLSKPFDIEELTVRIENLLQNFESRKQADSADELPKDENPLISESDRKWLESFELFVDRHLADDILSVPQLAREFTMSESTLLRQLKRLTGLTPVQYLREVRLNAARTKLEQGAAESVSEIAFEVGYKDARSFSRSFKKRFGKLPSEVLE